MTNTLILALDRYDIDPNLDLICSYFNLTFTFIFCIELLIKVIGLGPKKYFKDYMNNLDCIVVIISIIEIVLNDSQMTFQP